MKTILKLSISVIFMCLLITEKTCVFAIEPENLLLIEIDTRHFIEEGCDAQIIFEFGEFKKTIEIKSGSVTLDGKQSGKIVRLKFDKKILEKTGEGKVEASVNKKTYELKVDFIKKNTRVLILTPVIQNNTSFLGFSVVLN